MATSNCLNLLLLLLVCLQQQQQHQVLALHTTHAQPRIWDFIPTANFRQKENWIGGSVPCAKDSVSLTSTPALIGLTLPMLRQREIRFPDADGSATLVLFDGAGIEAFDESLISGEEQCPGGRIRNLKFNFTNPTDWFLTDNWLLSTATGVINKVEFNALPVDLLPGACDTVRFRDNATFLVKLMGHSDQFRVGQLQLAGRTFSTEDDENQLKSLWLQSDLMKSQFVYSNGDYVEKAPFLIVQPADLNRCEIPTALQSPKWMSRVCESNDRFKKSMISCSSPIPSDQVSGACSDLCGSVVIKFRASVDNFNFQNLIEKLTQRIEAGETHYTVRLSAFRLQIGVPEYQLVLSIADGNNHAILAVNNALLWLESNADAFKFSIINTLRSSDIGIVSAETSKLSTAYTVGLTTLFILLIVIAAILAAVFVGRKRGWLNDLSDVHPRRVWQAWNQWRHRTLKEEATAAGVEFTAATGSVEFSSGNAPEPAINMTFTNPVYNTSQPEIELSSVQHVQADREL